MGMIKNKNVLVFGDMHISSTFQGQHRDYQKECLDNMDSIVEKVKKHKPCAVFFLGDLIGVKEVNVRSREFLLEVILFFKKLNHLTNGNVYSVKGNHDFGSMSDFDFLVGLGLIKNCDDVDLVVDDGGKEKKEVRFHIVNYGDFTRKLNFEGDEGCSHVVLAHQDFHIEGAEDWYKTTKERLDIDKMKNFRGVDLVLSGHIHAPSSEILYGQEGIGLFYLGSPARVTERYDDCWYVLFSYDDVEKSTNYHALSFGLEPARDVFYPLEDFKEELTEEELFELEEQEAKNKRLKDIVNEIIEGRLTEGNLFEQIKKVPFAEDKVKELASDYLRKAIEEV